ncbi:LLM class flavin-dependent oxidoreductase [Pseudonocardia hispaniensis]|uniref:LLM class flavin-dependent oxidoreductase n=1 Tax=Pseudonocardia hispaniensis TaxID=904933 RepID=A0ABW1IX48_9PSEU
MSASASSFSPTVEHVVTDGEAYVRELTAELAKANRGPDGLSSREQFDRRPLNLGLFLPSMNGGGAGNYPTRLMTGKHATFEYNVEVAKAAEAAGLDFVFPAARWAGDGGTTRFNDYSLEAITLTAGLAALTERIMVLTTWHILYGFHPVHVAKMGATLDHMSGGRWGMNLVAGRKQKEIQQFGRALDSSQDRYGMMREFITMVQDLWASDEPIDLEGEYFTGRQCLTLPKPVQRPNPLLVNAGQSAAGVEFTTKFCDAAFIHGGRDNDLDELADVIQTFRTKAKENGREIKLVLPVAFLCRSTEAESNDLRRRILDAVDTEAATNILQGYQGSRSDTVPTRGQLETIVLGIGGYKLYGSHDQALEELVKLHRLGIDAFHFVCWNPLNDIDVIGEHFMPEFERLGLRTVR